LTGLILLELSKKVSSFSEKSFPYTNSFNEGYHTLPHDHSQQSIYREPTYSSHERQLHDSMPVYESTTSSVDWKHKLRNQLQTQSFTSAKHQDSHHRRSLQVTIGNNTTEIPLTSSEPLSYEHSRQLSNDGYVTVCANAHEGQTAVLQCPSGYTVQDITFASYGLPGGSCNNYHYGNFEYHHYLWYGYYYFYRVYAPVYCYRSYYCGPRYYYYYWGYYAGYYCSMYSVCSYSWYSYRAYGQCHAYNSYSVVRSLCYGKERCDVPAQNYLFGDPCWGAGKRLAIQATCEGGCTDNRVPYVSGAYWQRLDSKRVRYTCRWGYYNSAAGSLGGNPSNDGDVATCNGVSFDTSTLTLQCTPVDRGYYSPGDNKRYECDAGTYSYPWHITASSPRCSGYCAAGYYCPKYSYSPYQNECGGIDRYCPYGSAAPITVPRGYLSGPQTYTIWWGYSWWYYWWYWYSTPNPYWYVRTYPYPVTRRYYIELCPANRKCSGGDYQPIFQFEDNKVCSGANSSFSVTIVEDNQVTKQLGSTIALNVSDYTGNVNWNLTNDVKDKDHYWYSSFLVSPLYHGLYTWANCDTSAISIVNINQKTAMIQVSPSANLNIEKCGRRFPLTIRASMATDSSAAVTCILHVDVVRSLRPPVIVDCLPRVVEEGVSSGTAVGQPLVGAQLDKNNVDKIHQPGVSIRWFTNSSDFAIDTCSGQLYTANTLWRNAGGNLRTVQITAVADGSAMGMGTTSVYCNLQVTLTRQNNLPAISTTSLSIPELRPNGTFVGQIIATDPDVEDKNALVYSFGVLDSTDPLAFSINSTGAVFTTKELDVIKYPKREYKYYVNVSDTLGMSAREITIQVTPEDRPPVVQAQTINVYENTPANVKISPALSASHPQGKNMTWTISASTVSSIFNITYDGYIYVLPSATLDYYVQSQYTLTVTVTDTSSKSTNALITVQIIEVNTRPAFPYKQYNGTIDEYSKPGNAVSIGGTSTVTATDRNTHDKLTYSFVSAQPNEGLNYFSIDATSGLIKVASNSITNDGLVYDSNLTYVSPYTFFFVVNVTDDGIPALWATTTVKINITNIRPRILSTIIYAPLDDVMNGFAIGNVSLWQASSSAGLTGNLSLRYIINPANDEKIASSPIYTIAYNAFFIDSSKGSIASSNASAIDYLHYRNYPINVTANYRVPSAYSVIAPATSPNSTGYSAANATNSALASALANQEVSTSNLVYIYLLHRNRAPVWRSVPRLYASQREYGSFGIPLIGYVDDPDTLLPSYELNETLTFSIASGNTPDNAVAINTTTGQLQIIKPMSSYLQYVWGAAPPTVNLTIQVCDQGKSADVNYTTINILCSNVNATVEILEGNLPPVISNTTASRYLVAENATIGTLVGNPFRATDPDIGQTLVWSLLSSGSNSSGQYFRIDKYSGQLRVNASLDYEIQNTYNLIVVVTDNGRIPLSTSWYITINIIDINEPPSLVPYVPTGSSLPLTIPENSPINTYVGKLLGSDPDKADFANRGNITYSYLTYGIIDSSTCAFTIDKTTGSIYVAKPKLLNTEINPVLTCQYIVYDSGWDKQTALNATLVLSISILNRNDAPWMDDSRYLVVEGDYLAQYSNIIVQDEDARQPHRWYLTRPNSFCWYYRQSLSLWYFTNVLLAFGLTAPYDFAPVPVLTYEGGNNNNIPPVAIEFRVRGSGTAHVTVSTGPDENNFRYEVVVSPSSVSLYRYTVRNIKAVVGRGASATVTSQFVSTPTLLAITSVRNYTLDAEGLQWSHYTFRIDMVAGTLSVGLRPDNDPANSNSDISFISFSDNEFPVFRSTLLGKGGSLYVGSTTDSPDQRISSICFVPTAKEKRSAIRSNSFYMAPTSNLLYSYNLDYESIQSWGMEVLVQDIPDGATSALTPMYASDYAVVAINVMDTNEPPYFPEESRVNSCENVRLAFMSSGINMANSNPMVILCVTMNENIVAGTTIGSITAAVDPDIYAPDDYGYVTYTPAYGTEVIDVTTLLTASSSTVSPIPSTITTLIDIDTKRNGARVATVKYNNTFDYEKAAMYAIPVWAKDKGDLYSESPGYIIISLVDINEPPSIVPKKSTLTVPENSYSGTLVGTPEDLGASDPDVRKILFSTLKYSIVGGTGTKHFSINATTGQIYVDNIRNNITYPLNYEVTSSYTLFIQVTDGGGLTSNVATFTIALLNVNDVPVMKLPTVIKVNENFVGTFGPVLDISDEDVGSILSLTVVGGNGLGIFSSSACTGRISALENPEYNSMNPSETSLSFLDFETQQSYNLVLSLMDNGVPSLSTMGTTTIVIVDVNEPPIVRPLFISVDEGTKNSTLLGLSLDFYCTDPDQLSVNTAWATLTYSIMGGNTNDLFGINNSTGQLFANKDLINLVDPNTQTEVVYTLTISVRDGGGLVSITNIVVTVIGTNYPPTFITLNSTVYTIDEDCPRSRRSKNEIIGRSNSNTIIATDRNIKQIQDLSFHIDSTVPSFAIDYLSYQNLHSGIIQLTVTELGAQPNILDYESLNNITVRISVTDPRGAVGYSEIIIQLNNRNEDPYISYYPSETEIPENATVGTTVITTCIRGDNEDNINDLRYTITGGNEAGIFGIDNSNCNIFIQNNTKLDYETIRLYTLTISVQDTGKPENVPLSSSTKLVINVVDVNESPFWIATPTLYLYENSPIRTSVLPQGGANVLKASVNDVDQGDIYSLSFALNETAWTKDYPSYPVLFTVEASGNITVNTALTTNQIIQYLDYDTPVNTFKLMLQVIDRGNLYSNGYINIQLYNVNEAPTWVLSSPLSFYSILKDKAIISKPLITNVNDVDSFDKNIGEKLSFYFNHTGLITNVVLSPTFDITACLLIDPLSGQISFGNTSGLPYSPTGIIEFNTSVCVRDNENLYSCSPITIRTTDQNDPPQLSPIAISIDENTLGGTVISIVSATDPQPTQTVTYTLYPSSSSSPTRIPFPFELIHVAGNPGTAKLQVISNLAYLLDYESLYNKETNEAKFEGIITVTDSHLTVPLTVSTTVTITIKDINELPSFMATTNTSIIPRIVLSVNENSVSGTVLNFVPEDSSSSLLPIVFSSYRQNKVMHLVATDPDEADSPFVQPLAYGWYSSAVDSTFKIQNNGVIIIGSNPDTTLLNYENINIHVYRAKVTDHGGLVAYIDVEIRLIDVNEISYFVDGGSYNLLINASITDFTYTLSEAALSGTSFAQMKVKDVDDNEEGMLIYSLTANEESGPFVIDSTTGIISLSNSSSLDWEDTVVWKPEVQIMDSSNNPLVLKQTLTIHVTDVPDAMINGVYIRPEDNINNDTLYGIDINTNPTYRTIYTEISTVLGTTAGGLSITFTGGNLGPSYHRLLKDNLLIYQNTPNQLTTVTATYGPTTGTEFTATNCRVRDLGTAITCQQEAGYGIRHIWRIMINTNANIVMGGGLASSAFIANPTVLTGYIPPTISTVSFYNNQDTYFSTLGGTKFIIEGHNFGPLDTPVIVRYKAIIQTNTSFFTTSSTKNTISYTANNCIVTVAHTKIVCEASAGIGYNLAFTVQVGMDILQTSSFTNPTTVSYQPPVVTSITVSNDNNRMKTTGNEKLTIKGSNFGPVFINKYSNNINVLISLHYAPFSIWKAITGGGTIEMLNTLRTRVYSSVDCSIVDNTVIECLSVAGLGSSLYPILIVGGQLSHEVFVTEVPAISYLIHYQAPSITKIFGNQKDSLTTNGGQTFQILGENFGPVYDNNYDTILQQDNDISVLTAEPSILSRTPSVVYGYAYKHHLPPVQTLIPIASPQQNEGCEVYGRGKMYCDQQCSNIVWNCLASTGTWNKTILTNNKVCMVPVPPNQYVAPTPIFVPANDAKCQAESGSTYIAQYCKVIVPHTVIECTSHEGIGAYLSVTITALSGQFSSSSWPSTLSYANPVLTYYEGDGAHNADTRGGQLINIYGTNFGPLGTPFDVTYGIDGMEYVASNCSMVTAHSKISCITIDGAGSRLTFRVRIDNQYSTTPLMDYSIPIIDSITGPGADSASTEGGDIVYITGRYFGSHQNYLDFVTYGPSGVEYTARKCTITTLHTVIKCTIAPGTGRRLRWIVSIRGQLSKPSAQTTSYASPTFLMMSVTKGGTSGTNDVALVGYNLLGSGSSNILIAFNPYGLSGDNAVINSNEWNSWYNKTESGDPTSIPWPANIGKWFTYATLLPIKGTAISTDASSSLNPTTHLQSIIVDIPPGCGANRELFIIVDNIPSKPLVFTYTSPVITNVIAVKNPNNPGVLTVVVEGTNFCTPPGSSKQTTSTTGLALAAVMSNGASTASAATRRLMQDQNIPAYDNSNNMDMNHVYSRVLQSSTNSTTDNSGNNADTSSFLLVGGVPTFPSIVTNNILVINIPEPATIGSTYSIPINVGGPGIDALTTGSIVSQASPSFASVTLEWHNINTVGGQRILIPNVLSLGTNNTNLITITVGQRNCTSITIVRSYYYGNTKNPPVDENSAESVQYSWYNLSCTVPYGIGENVPVQITAPTGSSVSISALLSYKAPIITDITDYAVPATSYNIDSNPLNAVPTIGKRVTISGDYFGTSTKDTAPIITLSNSFSQIIQNYGTLVSYTQNTIVFDIPSGQGNQISMSVTVGNQVTAIPMKFRYANPVITSITPQITSTTGGTVITISGSNFGIADITASVLRGRPDITLNNRSCLLVNRTFNANNIDSIQCILPEGEGKDTPIIMSIAGQTGSFLYTYASPVISSVSHTHAPTSGGNTVMTITGTNFGTQPIVKFTPSTINVAKGIVEIAVPHTSMLSYNHTILTFIIPEGVGSGLAIQVLAGNQSSPQSSSFTFSYDMPTLSSRYAREGFEFVTCLSHTALVPRTRDGLYVNRTTIGNCYPTSGNVNIVINGTNLGNNNIPINVYIGTYALLLAALPPSTLLTTLPSMPKCSIISHDHNSLVCRLPPGMGDNLPLYVVVGDQINTAQPLFSYDPPVITSIIPNIPDGNGEEIIISGYNFGNENSSVHIMIGDLPCLDAYWVNDSMIKCTTQPTVVGPKNLEIIAGGRVDAITWSAEEEMIVIKCKSGSYGLRNERCINCATDEPGANCPGSELDIDKVTSLPGYYRLNITQSQEKHNQTRDCHPLRLNREACPVFLPCEPSDACLGANVCKEGYTGDRCGECAPDYYRISNKCRACPDRNAVLIIIFSLLGIITLTAMFMTAKQFISWPLVAIILDYGQILSLFNRFSIAWPNYIRLTILASSATTFNLELIAPECSLSNVSPAGRWAAAQLMPVAAWVLILVSFVGREIIFPELRRGYLYYNLWRKGTTKNPITPLQTKGKDAIDKLSKANEKDNNLVPARRNWNAIQRHFQPYGAVMWATFRLLFIYIARNTLDVFDCSPTTPDISGKKYLGGNINIACYESGSLQMDILPPAIISILIFLMAIPLYGIYQLNRNRKIIFEDMMAIARGYRLSDFHRETKSTNTAAANFRSVYHILYHHFKPSRYGWEYVIGLRKFALVFVSLMFNRTAVFQQTFVLLILLISFGIHLRIKPYLSHERSAKLLQSYDPRIQLSTARELGRIAAAHSSSNLNSPVVSSRNISSPSDVHNAEVDGVELNEKERMQAAANISTRKRILRLKTLFTVESVDTLVIRGLLLQYPFLAFFVDPNIVETVLLGSLVLFNLLGIMLGSSIFTGANLDRFFADQYDQVCVATMVLLGFTFLYIIICIVIDIALRIDPEIVDTAIVQFFGRICSSKITINTRDLLNRHFHHAQSRSTTTTKKQFHMSNLNSIGLDVAKETIIENNNVAHSNAGKVIGRGSVMRTKSGKFLRSNEPTDTTNPMNTMNVIRNPLAAVSTTSSAIMNPIVPQSNIGQSKTFPDPEENVVISPNITNAFAATSSRTMDTSAEENDGWSDNEGNDYGNFAVSKRKVFSQSAIDYDDEEDEHIPETSNSNNGFTRRTFIPTVTRNNR